jgi:uncharacterized protein (TIGR00369 family)
VLAAGDHLFQQLSLRDVDDDVADLAMEMDVDDRFTNPRGGLQGGLVATLVDVVAGRAVFDGTPKGQHVSTADLSIHYLRGVTRGPARARATVLRRGRNLAVVSVEVIDMGTGELAAVSNLTFAVLPARRDDTAPATDRTRDNPIDGRPSEI